MTDEPRKEPTKQKLAALVVMTLVGVFLLLDGIFNHSIPFIVVGALGLIVTGLEVSKYDTPKFRRD